MQSNNSLQELNNQLFATLRNLNTDLTGKELKEELQKAKAISEIGKVIVDNHKNVLDAIKLVQDGKLYADKVQGLIGN